MSWERSHTAAVYLSNLGSLLSLCKPPSQYIYLNIVRNLSQLGDGN